AVEWQTIQAPFNKFTSREDWQPQTATVDQVMDFPLKSFQFEPKKSGKGELFIDCVFLVDSF
ncbi:MAG: hypothetical protein KC713_05280, partial [Candidatus Omnitrophica bacterium]|nr:hypothetical protein [Candidatus Omnitrophota bacterium]